MIFETTADVERRFLKEAWGRLNVEQVGESSIHESKIHESSIHDYDSLLKSEWSPKFEKAMRSRLVIGAFRYGLLNDPTKKGYDRLGRILHEVEAYIKDGNDERLVDIANHALLEFEEGKHPNKHFNPSGEDGFKTKEVT